MHNVIQLSEEDLNVFNCIKTNIISSPLQDENKFIKEVDLVKKCLPQKLKNKLYDFSKNGSDKGFLLIKGFPIDDKEIPPTPQHATFSLGGETQFAKLQAIVNQTLGEMIGCEAQGGGRVFQDMIPDQKLAKTQTGIGSEVELDVHTEQAFSDLKPDFISLACLRSDPHAKTYILHVSKILENLSEKERRLLREPLWKIGVVASFKLYTDKFLYGDIRGPIPIISGDETNPILVYNHYLMEGITDEAENLRKKILDIYYKHRCYHILKPGEILILDNRNMLHGRSAYKPNYDEGNRFICRTLVVIDYKKSCHARKKGSRMIQTYFT